MDGANAEMAKFSSCVNSLLERWCSVVDDDDGDFLDASEGSWSLEPPSNGVLFVVKVFIIDLKVYQCERRKGRGDSSFGPDLD